MIRVPARALILAALVVTLVASLGISTSVRFGHADVPIAPAAADIQPLQQGDNAPRFTVQTVGNERFDFDPRDELSARHASRALHPTLLVARVLARSGSTNVLAYCAAAARHGGRTVTPRRRPKGLLGGQAV